MLKLLSILFASLLMWNSKPVENISYVANDPEVIIIKKGGIGGDFPRQPTQVPISGIVTGNTIYLSFSDDLGDVDVTIEEYFDGLVLQTVVDGSFPTAVIPFNYGPGDYVITFTLSAGEEFIGSFQL